MYMYKNNTKIDKTCAKTPAAAAAAAAPLQMHIK